MTTAIYCRKSTKQKAGADQDFAPSVVVQERTCTEYAERNALSDVVVYTDDGLSGKAGVYRAEFERLKADIASGTVTGVIVFRTDRISRDDLDTLVFNREIRSRGVKLYSTSEGGLIDLDTAAGRLNAGVRSLFAANEREAASERTANQKRDAAYAGRVMGARFRQFGYADTKKTALHPTEADEVAQIFTKFLAGKSLYSIARDLNDRAVPTTGGHRFDSETIKRILRHGAYAGQREFKGQIVAQGNWPTIVSVANWQRARAKIDANKTGSKPSKRKYLLSGLLYCTNCNATLTANNNKYVCSPSHRGCGKISRTRTDIDRWVLKLTAKTLEQLLLAKPVEPVDTTALEQVILEIEQLSDAKAGGIIPMTEFLKQYQILNKKKDTLVTKSTRVSVSATDAAVFLSSNDIERQRSVIKSIFGSIGLKSVGRGVRFKPEHLVFEQQSDLI